MLKATAGFFVRLVERWIPDPYVIAVLLTGLVFLLSATLADYGVLETVEAWGDSFWGLLRFTGQIILTLVLGYAVANTGPAKRLLEAIAGRVTTARGAYMLVCFVGGVAALFSWGLSLVSAAVMARKTAEVCQAKGIRVHYPLLVAGGYSGFVVWHQGFSGSIPLAINTPDHFLADKIGLIGVSETILTPWSIILALFIVFTLPFIIARLAPDDDALRPLPKDLAPLPELEDPGPGEVHEGGSPAERLEASRLINFAVVGVGLVYLYSHFIARGDGLNLDVLNFIFLLLGLSLAASPRHYLELVTDAARVIGPFLIQYPLYAGLMGVMAASGLGAMVVEGFVGLASAESLPIWSFFSAGLLNVFVPSGGGQWAVQGPIVINAALRLGADVPRVAMAVALGDQWTNMIQPLFAIPALAIAGLHIRDIMGFCLITLFYTGVIFVVALTFF
ncbi:MAG: TIGR00366 family protein [Sphingomonadales bacterium]